MYTLPLLKCSHNTDLLGVIFTLFPCLIICNKVCLGGEGRGGERGERRGK